MPKLSNEAAQRMVQEMIVLLNEGGWESETDEIDAKVESWLTDAEYPKSADRSPSPALAEPAAPLDHKITPCMKCGDDFGAPSHNPKNWMYHEFQGTINVGAAAPLDQKVDLILKYILGSWGGNCECVPCSEACMGCEECGVCIKRLKDKLAEILLAAAPSKGRDDAGFDEATETRWQTAIYELCKEILPDVDGGGCDSGDALDVTLSEISQVFGHLQEAGAAPSSVPGQDRTDKDYAIEHGGYLADAAQAYLDQKNLHDMAVAEYSDEAIDTDSLSDHHAALRSAIYEFRKRSARASSPSSATEQDIWPVINHERGLLIDKQITGKISPLEAKKLEALNAYADANLEAITPSSSAGTPEGQ